MVNSTASGIRLLVCHFRCNAKSAIAVISAQTIRYSDTGQVSAAGPGHQ